MSTGAQVLRAGRGWSERLLAVPAGVTGAERRRARTLLGVSTILAIVVVPVVVLIRVTVPDENQALLLGLLGWVFYGAIRWLVGRRHAVA
ncbi:MAG TPA: hypothetical protein VFX15_14870, partial [Actinomycetes bacterium]|nr:hypothetical protein [Actinomycetes bacterium]